MPEKGFCANCWVIESDGEYAIVDPGVMTDELKQIALENGNKIKYILLTHGHFDHVLGVAQLKQLCGAKTVIHPLDKDGLSDPSVSLSIMFGVSQSPTSADILVDEGDMLTLGSEKISVIHTPGHTSGGVCYIIGDKMFCGDTLFRDSIGRTDLPSGDYDTLMQSVERICALGEYELYTGHGDVTTLERERKFNAFINY